MHPPIGVTVELFHIGNVFVVGVIGASESNWNTIILCLMVKATKMRSLVELTVWTYSYEIRNGHKKWISVIHDFV